MEPLNALWAGSPPSLSVEVSPCPGWDAEIPVVEGVGMGLGPQTLQGCCQLEDPVLNTNNVFISPKGLEREPRNDIPVLIPAGNTDPPMALGEYLGCCRFVWGSAVRKSLGELRYFD